MPQSATEILAPLRPTPSSDAANVTASAPELLNRSLKLCAADLAKTEIELARLLHSDIAVIPDVVGHLAFAGGKRFRPLLCLLSAAAAGFDDPVRITIAAVGELLHTATLLHDDVIDEGAFRRGRPAARMPFGNGMAVLTGDFCLARALGAVADTGKLVAIQSLSDAVTKMAEGEVAQLHAAGDAVPDRERYSMVIERKTAALISWCAAVAGLVDPAYVEPLTQYGLQLGYAFQVADDLLDYRFDAVQIGKTPGQDLREGKMTLPLILACEADQTLRRRVEVLIAKGPPLEQSWVDEIVMQVRCSTAIEQTTAVATQHVQSAFRCLDALPPSAARDALAGVAHYVVRRDC